MNSGPAPGRTIVKVCGLTRAADAAWALACGADWLGFIVGAGGPRDIGAAGMAAIVATLPPGTTAIAVVAGDAPETAFELARAARATRLQVHGAGAAAWPAEAPLPCAFVTRVDGAGHAAGPLAPPPHLVHLDTAHATLAGGTGTTFPWGAARGLCGGRAFMLAGGLGPDNVAAALAAAAPMGVDASSRLESAPGIKDPELVRRYVAAVREYDAHERFHA